MYNIVYNFNNGYNNHAESLAAFLEPKKEINKNQNKSFYPTCHLENFQFLLDASPEVYSSKRLKKIEQMVVTNLATIHEQEYFGVSLKNKYWVECGKQHLCIGMVEALKEKWLKSESKTLPLPVWFKQAAAQLENIEKVQLCVLNDQDRQAYEVHFCPEKQAFVQQGKLFSTQHYQTSYVEKVAAENQDQAIYVIGPDKKMYVASHIDHQFYHSSFFGGASLIGAGECKINDQGQLVAISNRSGHYEPNIENLLDTLQILSEQNVDLRHVDVYFYQDSKPVEHYASAQHFLDKSGSCLPSHIENITIKQDENGEMQEIIWNKEETETDADFFKFSTTLREKLLLNLPLTIFDGEQSTQYHSSWSYIEKIQEF